MMQDALFGVVLPCPFVDLKQSRWREASHKILQAAWGTEFESCDFLTKLETFLIDLAIDKEECVVFHGVVPITREDVRVHRSKIIVFGASADRVLLFRIR